MILNFFSYRTSLNSHHEQEQAVKGLGTQLTSEPTTNEFHQCSREVPSKISVWPTSALDGRRRHRKSERIAADWQQQRQHPQSEGIVAATVVEAALGENDGAQCRENGEEVKAYKMKRKRPRKRRKTQAGQRENAGLGEEEGRCTI
ncbi:uncharacterized protein HKW66_Vig0248990 [Vigna angularis]|uniref:Uncharacterized protein n=1 Tax=Phaseolus angularis TaxID=3914 RepID=A0A8T0JUP2_PHAAN|nr:uncharacterized protein HKW66_Vig0248990 [Vigna angularis]